MNNIKKFYFLRAGFLVQAEHDVFKMAHNDMFGTLLMVKHICKEYKLDPYNFMDFELALDILKYQVSWN